MMSDHNTNPIFLIKKIKTGRLEHSLTPTPQSKWKSFVYHPLSISLVNVTFTKKTFNEKLHFLCSDFSLFDSHFVKNM